MSVILKSVPFPPMAKKEKPLTEQVNVRLKVATMDRVDAYRSRQPVEISMTAIIEAALNFWLDQAEDIPKAKPRPK